MQPQQSNRPFNNFLAAWEKYYENTNLPRQFIIWSGIWIISSCLQDNVVLRDGGSALTPNLYIWFIGPAGTGKSETAKPAAKLLKLMPFIDLYDGQLTSLYLFKHLNTQQARRAMANPSQPNSRTAIFSDELSATMGAKQMAEELMKALTVMYSGSYKYGTGAHNLITIDDPILTWLACCSPPWLRRTVPRDMLDSGFIARIISIYEPLKQRRQQGVSADDNLRNALIRDLCRMNLLKGDFILTPDATALRNEWAEKQFEARCKMDEVIQCIYGREEEHTLKVAMCLAVANGNDLVVTKQAFINAAKLVLNARQGSLDVLMSIAASLQGQLKSYLLTIIQQLGPITSGDLRAKTHRRIDDTFTFHRLANALLSEGAIVMKPSNNGRGVTYEIANGGYKP